MKLVKLHDNKILSFPDHTSDEIIDHAVKSHLKPVVEEKEQIKAKESEQKQSDENKHNHLISLLDAVNGIGQLLHTQQQHHQQATQQTHELLSHVAKGHEAMAGAMHELAKAHSAPRKTKAIRDNQGKIIGSETV